MISSSLSVKAAGVLRLRKEEQLPVRRVASNTLQNQFREANKGWSSSLGVGRDDNNSTFPEAWIVIQIGITLC